MRAQAIVHCKENFPGQRQWQAKAKGRCKGNVRDGRHHPAARRLAEVLLLGLHQRGEHHLLDAANCEDDAEPLAVVEASVRLETDLSEPLFEAVSTAERPRLYFPYLSSTFFC